MYSTVQFLNGSATSGIKTEQGFEIHVTPGETFGAKKLIFATGIRDIMPGIEGFADCWGISVLHCPYCHGYEIKNEPTGILGNGELIYDFVRLISNWTKNLTLFTNGTSTLTVDQADQLEQHNIEIVEKEVEKLAHINGYIQNITFKDGSNSSKTALYAPVSFQPHCNIPESLQCKLNDEGYIKVDAFQETTVKGVFACGDNTTRMRTVANAVAMGTMAGVSSSKQLILEEF